MMRVWPILKAPPQHPAQRQPLRVPDPHDDRIGGDGVAEAGPVGTDEEVGVLAAHGRELGTEQGLVPAHPDEETAGEEHVVGTGPAGQAIRVALLDLHGLEVAQLPEPGWKGEVAGQHPAAKDDVRLAGRLGGDEMPEPVGPRLIVIVNEGHQLGTQGQRLRGRSVAGEGEAGAGLLDEVKGDRQRRAQPVAHTARPPVRPIVHHHEGEPLGVHATEIEIMEPQQRAGEEMRAVVRADANDDLGHDVRSECPRGHSAGRRNRPAGLPAASRTFP
jgi:hypothetical protein